MAYLIADGWNFRSVAYCWQTQRSDTEQWWCSKWDTTENGPVNIKEYPVMILRYLRDAQWSGVPSLASIGHFVVAPKTCPHDCQLYSPLFPVIPRNWSISTNIWSFINAQSVHGGAWWCTRPVSPAKQRPVSSSVLAGSDFAPGTSPGLRAGSVAWIIIDHTCSSNMKNHWPSVAWIIIGIRGKQCRLL